MKNNINSIIINPESININELTLIRYIGYKDQDCPEPVRTSINDILSHCHSYLNIKSGWVVYKKLDIKVLVNKIICKEKEFLCGKIISSGLNKSDELILFLLTIGPGIEEWSRKCFMNNKPLHGYIINILGSVIAEASVDILYDYILKEMEKKGLHLTNRYSPGYCGWDVSEQHKLFSFFPKGFCGITLTESALMVPVKSVSGIIGAGCFAKKKVYQCKACPKNDCLMRKQNNRIT